jgi:hypothetical protein
VRVCVSVGGRADREREGEKRFRVGGVAIGKQRNQWKTLTAK